MSDLLPTYHIATEPRALHYSFEKAGLVLHDQPIPWNAEAVLVEANLRLAGSQRQPADFTLQLPGRGPVSADAVRRRVGDDSDRHSVSFRLIPPTETQTAVLQWRGQELGRLELPVLSREQFLDGLRLHLPTLYVQLGGDSVACKTFVSSQCKGLLASALLTSPTSLAPLADLNLAVEFRSERKERPAEPDLRRSGSAGHSSELGIQRVAVRLNSTQLATRQALFTVLPLKHPRKLGTWSASWLLGERELARQEVKGISLRQFQKSLRVIGTRFVLQTEPGPMTIARSLPPPEQRSRVGPCFVVCSREAGMAGLCSLRVGAVVPGEESPLPMWEQDTLISDGPVLVVPGTLEGADLARVQAFDLSLQGRSLAVLGLTPAPSATFTTEGGFNAPSEFTWTSAADEELDQRLSRLLEERFR